MCRRRHIQGKCFFKRFFPQCKRRASAASTILRQVANAESAATAGAAASRRGSAPGTHKTCVGRIESGTAETDAPHQFSRATAQCRTLQSLRWPSLHPSPVRYAESVCRDQARCVSSPELQATLVTSVHSGRRDKSPHGAAEIPRDEWSRPAQRPADRSRAT